MALPEPSLTRRGACCERHPISQGVESPADVQGRAFWTDPQGPLQTRVLTHRRGCSCSRTLTCPALLPSCVVCTGRPSRTETRASKSLLSCDSTHSRTLAPEMSLFKQEPGEAGFNVWQGLNKSEGCHGKPLSR